MIMHTQPNGKHRELANLGYITRRFAKEVPTRITIAEKSIGEGTVWFDWPNGDVTWADFASFAVLIDWLNRRRNLRGVEVYPRGETAQPIGTCGSLTRYE